MTAPKKHQYCFVPPVHPTPQMQTAPWFEYSIHFTKDRLRPSQVVHHEIGDNGIKRVRLERELFCVRLPECYLGISTLSGFHHL
jgi:hypothetical protein